MSSPWKKKQQPEVVVDAVLKRAEVGKIGRKLKARLALAQYKAARGWEDLTLDTIEPKIEEELRQRRPLSSGDIFSDSSSSTTSISDFRYSSSRTLMSSPLKAPAIFSDQVGSRSGSSIGHPRKRHLHNIFEHPSSSPSSSACKRFRSSPTAGRSVNAGRTSWKDSQLAQSSPIKPKKHTHFTTSSGPGLSFFGVGAEDIYSHPFSAAASDDEENTLPAHSFDIRSSPPRTPSPLRHRGTLGRSNRDRSGKSGEEGADLLLYLATSPSPAHPSRARMAPPSTPPPKNLALPSSMMTTPGGVGSLLPGFGAPVTPSQGFDFSDFVNITPSPAQSAWPKTAKTPLTVARRRLTFDNFNSSGGSPNSRNGTAGSKHTAGLSMQLGGDLIS